MRVVSFDALACAITSVPRTTRVSMKEPDFTAALEEAEAATAASLAGAQAADLAAAASGKQRFDVRSLAGVSAPLGFWDPASFCEGKSEGTLRFYREVEIKHGRVAMLAAVGFPIAEQFHPLWGGDIDVPSYLAFQQTPLQTFWPVVTLVIGMYEANTSVFTFARPYDLFYSDAGGVWQIRPDHLPGDMRFDPLGLVPADAEARLEMETKELNHGRLAMLGIAGMVAQELATGQKLG